MQIKDYLADILAALSTNPYVESQDISFSERPPDAAYVSGMVTFVDGSQFHIKEFIFFDSVGESIIKYGYNYLDRDGKLIFRYDNALDPKARGLSTYPEHKHNRDGVSAANRPRIEEILQEIAQQVRRSIRL
jgi:hypothetical protein